MNTGKPRYNEHGYSENPVITRTFLGARFFFHRPPCILFSYNEIGYSEISAITRQIPSPRIRKKKRNQPRYYEHSVTATPRSEGNATTAHSQAIFFAPLNTDHTHRARIHTHTHRHTCIHVHITCVRYCLCQSRISIQLALGTACPREVTHAHGASTHMRHRACTTGRAWRLRSMIIHCIHAVMPAGTAG